MLTRLVSSIILLTSVTCVDTQKSPAAPDIVVAELTRKFLDADAFVHLRAVTGLAQLGKKTEPAIARLAEIAVQNPDEDVRLRASRALGQNHDAVKAKIQGQAAEQLTSSCVACEVGIWPIDLRPSKLSVPWVRLRHQLSRI